MEPLVPDVEEFVPLPANAAEAMPQLSAMEEMEMAARTVQLISDITGAPITTTKEDSDKVYQVAKKYIEDPRTKPDLSDLTLNQTALLRGMLKQYDFELVEDLARLKNVVVNGLFEEAVAAKDSKTKIQALKALGEIDGVDAFKRRSEVTHVIKPLEEVEKELLSVLDGIEYTVVGEESSENSCS
jgi:hypothetical protein